MALNHEFSIFWTYSGRLAALNQDFGCNSWSGATKCPEKFSVALSVMSLLKTFYVDNCFPNLTIGYLVSKLLCVPFPIYMEAFLEQGMRSSTDTYGGLGYSILNITVLI